MKLLDNLLKEKRKKSRLTENDYYQESLNKMGEKQFQKMIEKGLALPIGVL